MIKPTNTNEQTVLNFIDAYEKLDIPAVGALLADNVVAYITNKDASVDRVVGKAAYLERQAQSNIEGVSLKLNITQMITIDTGQVMLMVSIEAKRGAQNMHNHGAFLITVIDQKISQFYMVDALPAYSDEFWKQ